MSVVNDIGPKVITNITITVGALVTRSLIDTPTHLVKLTLHSANIINNINNRFTHNNHILSRNTNFNTQSSNKETLFSFPMVRNMVAYLANSLNLM